MKRRIAIFLTVVFLIFSNSFPALSSSDYNSEKEDEYETEIYGDPSFYVNAGGPYNTVPGGLVSFEGYFIMTEDMSINITGYSWDFGDGSPIFYYDFEIPINYSSYQSLVTNPNIGILCPASHVYNAPRAYSATLKVYIKNFPLIKNYKTNDGFFRSFITSDTAEVIIAFDPWDEQYHPSRYFKKQVWDNENGWSNTTSCRIGDTIQFKISYNPTSRTENGEVKEYLPSTVQLLSTSIPPDSSAKHVYFDESTDSYTAVTYLHWDIGDLNPGETLEIIIEGKVEYLTKTYFGIPDDEYPIDYKTENVAKLSGTKRSPGCGNRYNFYYSSNANFEILENQSKLEIKKFVKRNCNGQYSDEGIVVEEGYWVTFWLMVNNTGEVPLDVVVTDILPSGLSYKDYAYVDGVPVEPIFIDDHNFYWNIEELKVGEIVNITFAADIVDCGRHINFAKAVGSYNNQVYEDSDTASVGVICAPDVDIEKLVRKNECDPWSDHLDLRTEDEIFFKILINNTGGTVLNLLVEDTLSYSLEYIENSANYEPSIVGKTLNWVFENVKPTDTPIEIEFKTKAVRCGSVINWAYVAGIGQEAFDEDNVTLNIECKEPELFVEKKVWNGFDWSDYAEVSLCETVYFKAEIHNPNDYLVQFSGNIIDYFPENLRYINESANIPDNFHEEVYLLDNKVIWTDLSDILPHESLIFTFNATAVSCGLGTNNLISNAYAIVNDNLVPISDSDEVIVFVSCPSIEIEKEANPSTVYSGDLVAYTYTIKNTGNTPLKNINVDDDKGLIPAYISGDINENEKLDLDEIWIYKATTIPTEDICNIGSVIGEDNLGYVVYDEDYACVTVLCKALDLEVEKKIWNGCDWVESTEVNLGDNVRFKAVIYNPNNCYEVHFSGVVFDQLPTNLRYVNGSSTIYDEGGWSNLETVDWENNTVYWYEPLMMPPLTNIIFYYNATAVECGIGINNLTSSPFYLVPIDGNPDGIISNDDGSLNVSDSATVNVICECDDEDDDSRSKAISNNNYNYLQLSKNYKIIENLLIKLLNKFPRLKHLFRQY